MSLSLIAQDVEAFIAAQDQLRAELGSEAQFGVPTTPQWPPGTAINPDTDMPYDATLVPVNDEYQTVAVTVLVIEKKGSPLRAQPDPTNVQSASGLREGMDIILDVAAADYVATVAGATMFAVMGQNFSIVERKPFTIAGRTYRWLVYGGER